MRLSHVLIGIVAGILFSSCSQENADYSGAVKELVATETPPPRDIAGISIGQPANLPECEKERSYGTIHYKTFPSNVPCWSHTIFHRENLVLSQEAEMPANGTLQVGLGSKNVPEGVYDVADIEVIDGKIEGIKLKTFGQSHQEEILSLLANKWGNPTTSNVQQLQNSFGAKFQGIEAQWLFGDFTIAFFGILTKPDEGLIVARSAAVAAKEKAQSSDRASSF